MKGATPTGFDQHILDVSLFAMLFDFCCLMMVHSGKLTKSNKDGAFEDEFFIGEKGGFSSAMLVLPEDIDKYVLWATYMLLVPSIQTGV